MRSLQWRLAAALDPLGEPAVAGLAQLGNCEVQLTPPISSSAADAADHLQAARSAVLAGRRR